jgi:hypothetical protein
MSPFKSIKGRALGKLLEGYKSSDIGKGFGSGGGVGGPYIGTGGNVDALRDVSTNNVYHTFISPGTFIMTGGVENAEIFLVGPGGGGAGGNGGSGGGGAGGIVHLTGHTIQSGVYSIEVPAGGAGGASSNDNGVDGGDATIIGPDGFSLTAKGGGGGSGWTRAPNPGGCGGGAAGPGPDNGGTTVQATTPQNTGAGGGSIASYGFAGGATPGGTPYMGGGGGGTAAVGAGGGASPGNGGAGSTFPNYTGNLIGVPAINGYAGQYGGGGGGMSETPQNRDGGDGGAGGGGKGAYRYAHSYGSPGLRYTGGGGGGGQWWPTGSTSGGDGGSGMVVIRYLQADVANAQGTALPDSTMGYRYYRLYKLDGATSGSWHNEVQFFEVGSSSYYQGTNYQNWSASGSISLAGSWQTELTNNNLSSNAIHTDGAGVGQTLTLDLGAGNEKLFNKVKLWHGTNAYAYWRWEASNDGSSWATLHKGMQVNGNATTEMMMGS